MSPVTLGLAAELLVDVLESGLPLSYVRAQQLFQPLNLNINLEFLLRRGRRQGSQLPALRGRRGGQSLLLKCSE